MLMQDHMSATLTVQGLKLELEMELEMKFGGGGGTGELGSTCPGRGVRMRRR